MPRAICEDCGSLVEAELTHNGICAVGHYVHCGWGHELSPDDLISDDVVEIIADLEAKLAKATEALREFAKQKPTTEMDVDEYDQADIEGAYCQFIFKARAALAELEE